MKKQQGWGLIELMIVVAIIGIIAGVVIGPIDMNFEPHEERCIGGFKYIVNAYDYSVPPTQVFGPNGPVACKKG